MYVVHGRLPGIIEMRRAVPDAIAFAHLNVIHLDRQVDIELGLPEILEKDVFSDSEWRIEMAGVLDCVDARFVREEKSKRAY